MFWGPPGGVPIPVPNPSPPPIVPHKQGEIWPPCQPSPSGRCPCPPSPDRSHLSPPRRVGSFARDLERAQKPPLMIRNVLAFHAPPLQPQPQPEGGDAGAARTGWWWGVWCGRELGTKPRNRPHFLSQRPWFGAFWGFYWFWEATTSTLTEVVSGKERETMVTETGMRVMMVGTEMKMG